MHQPYQIYYKVVSSVLLAMEEHLGYNCLAVIKYFRYFATV